MLALPRAAGSRPSHAFASQGNSAFKFSSRNSPTFTSPDRSSAPTSWTSARSLKRLFACAAKVHADLEEKRELPLEGSTFADASTHWLRHFFATSAANDGFDPFVLKDQMGHASIETTMLYVHPERRALVAHMAKLRRRG